MDKDNTTPKQRLDRVSPISKSGRNQSCNHVDTYETTVNETFQSRSAIEQPFSVGKSKQTHVIVTEDHGSETHSDSSLTDSAYQTPEDQESETDSDSTESTYHTPDYQRTGKERREFIAKVMAFVKYMNEDHISETNSDPYVTDSTQSLEDQTSTEELTKKDVSFIARHYAQFRLENLNMEDHPFDTDSSDTDSAYLTAEDQE